VEVAALQHRSVAVSVAVSVCRSSQQLSALISGSQPFRKCQLTLMLSLLSADFFDVVAGLELNIVS